MPTTLYRPVGLDELALIWDSGCKEFPPRLPEQPIFYPVTSAEYARQIAHDWNTKTPSFAGFVTAFSVDDAYLARFDRHIVGSSGHEEYWIPADELPSFNQAIIGRIEVEAAFFGESFTGFVPDQFNLKGKSAKEQFVFLARSWEYSRMDFTIEVVLNQKAVYLNCLFWMAQDFSVFGIAGEMRRETFGAILKTWDYEHIEPELPAAVRDAFPKA
jgi:hypothetical protein